MTTIYLDSSALMRRYDPREAGADSVRAICQPRNGHDLVLVRITTVEIASAIGRKYREGQLDARARSQIWRAFISHIRDQYQVVDLNDIIYARAEEIVCTHAVRAADAVHLACALQTAASVTTPDFQFWTADRRQARAVSAEGLAVRLVGADENEFES